MRKLMEIGACVGFALVLSGCGDQGKKTQDAAKDAVAQTQGQLDKAGKAVQDAGATAGKAVQDAGATAGKAVDAAAKAALETKAKISAAASKASEALGEQFTKATEQASKSLQSVKGAPELTQKLSAVLPSLQKTLAGITDKESAQKALPKLEELEGTVSKLAGQFEQLPEGAKKTVGELIQKGASSLQPLVDNVLALPAVESIRPRLEGIMTQLKGLTD
jgi:hypothetical protein